MEVTLRSAPDRFAERDQIDLAVLVAALRTAWKAGLVGAIVLGLVELARLHDEPSMYVVQMEVVPLVASDQTGSYADALPQRADPPKSAAPKNAVLFDVYLQTLRSRAIADELAMRPLVMQSVFHGQWDGARNRWTEQAGALDLVRHRLQSALGWPVTVWQPPGGAQLHEYLRSNLIVHHDPKEHFFATVEFETSRTGMAQGLLLTLHDTANDLLGPAARVLGAPSIRPDSTNRPWRSVFTAMLLGAATGIVGRLAIRRRTASRCSQIPAAAETRSDPHTVA
jgi:hypothetical protein